MDPVYKWAGGVYNFHIPLFQPFKDIAAHTVGADNDCLSRKRLFRGIDHRYPHSVKMFHHMVIMDNRPKRYGFLSLSGTFLHHFHSSADTKAEARAFRYGYAHKLTRCPMMRFISARTSSTVILEESSFTESRAILRGAICR